MPTRGRGFVSITRAKRLDAAARQSEKLVKVSSLMDLRVKARDNPKYVELAICAAQNLGGQKNDTKDFESAMQWLNTNAMEVSEKDVVGEVNFCIPLMKG